MTDDDLSKKTKKLKNNMPGRSYEVGYGKPPKDKMFKKGGPSPNPHGRPPKKETFYTAVLRHLSQEIKVTTADGEVRDIEKRDLIAERVVQKAAMGDIQAIKIISQIDEGYADQEAQKAAEEEARPVLPAADLVKTLREAKRLSGTLEEEELYYQDDKGAFHAIPAGKAMGDFIKTLKGGHIKTIEGYKSGLADVLDAIDEMAFGYLVQWNPDLKKSDLV